MDEITGSIDNEIKSGSFHQNTIETSGSLDVKMVDSTQKPGEIPLELVKDKPIINRDAKGRILKGSKLNPKGRTVGIPELAPSIRKKLKKQRLDNIAEVLIAGAERGEDKKIETLLKLSGELNNDNAQALIINNTSIISDDIVEAAREYLKNKNKPKIIDITPIKIQDNKN